MFHFGICENAVCTINLAKGKLDGVSEQSGLFAGEGGYHVNADSVNLVGGAIVSTADKEHNQLTTNALTFSNVENKSSYSASNVSLAGGYGTNKETDNKTTGNKGGDSKTTVKSNDTPTFTPGLPQFEKGKDSTTTYAVISPGQITINGKQTTVEELGIHSDASTAHSKVKDLPDLQAILDKQKAVAAATTTITEAARTYSKDQVRKAEEAKAIAREEAEKKLGYDYALLSESEKIQYLLEKDSNYAKAFNEAQNWGIGGDKSRLVNAVTGVVTGALGGQTDLQVATNAIAPYTAKLIGETFGDKGTDPNKAAQLTSHAILGAVVAAANGGNAVAGGSSAVAAELAADYLAKLLDDGKTARNAEGKFDPNLLGEDVKANIRDLSSAIAAVVGGVAGDSAFNAQVAGVIGQNAVENNRLLTHKEESRIRLLADDSLTEEKKYLAAACALVRCSASLADDHPQKAEYARLEDIGNSQELLTYRLELESQNFTETKGTYTLPVIFLYESTTPLFTYGKIDATADFSIRNKLGTRAEGGLTFIAGAGTTALGAVTSEFAIGIPLVVIGSDLMVAGGVTMYTGNYTPSLGAKGISSATGMSVEGSETIYASISLAGEAKALHSISKSGLSLLGKGNNGIAGVHAFKDVASDVGKIIQAERADRLESINKLVYIRNTNEIKVPFSSEHTNKIARTDGIRYFNLGPVGGTPLDVDVFRNFLIEQKFLKEKYLNGDRRAITVALAEYTVAGVKQYLASVSGKALHSRAPLILEMNGINYRMITHDNKQVVESFLDGVGNFGHAEKKIAGFFVEQGDNIGKARLAIQNESASKIGTCPRC